MKRRWGILIGLTLALATAATISAFTLTGGWGDNDDGPKPLPGEITQSDPADEERVSDVGSSQRPVTSIDDIDPDQCNRIHNITACEGEPKPSGGQGLVTSIDDVDPDQCNLFHNITACEGEPKPSGGQRLVTSIDDIDPDQCNLVHNINACSPEQLTLIGVGEPEPLFVDGEPGYVVQSPAEANEVDCGLAGGTVYVTFGGEEGCLIVHDLEDGDDPVSPPQPPSVEPEPVDPAL